MGSVFTGESYLFRGRWCVIGPCVGVKQAGTALCNPGSINPSALIHLSRILGRTSRYPYMIGATAKTETRRSESNAERKVFHKFRRVSAAAHSIAVILSSCNKTASSSAIPSCVLSASGSPPKSPESPLVDCAGSFSSPVAHGRAKK